MMRERSGQTDAQNKAHYAHAWMCFLAGEWSRPTYREYHLTFDDAVALQRLVSQVIDNAYKEPEDEPPDPAKYGITSERAKELDEEIMRLSKKAYDRRYHDE